MARDIRPRRRFTTAAQAGEYLDKLQETMSTEAVAAAADEAGVVTVSEAVERWLASQRIKLTTRAAYTATLAPVVDRFDDRDVRMIGDRAVEQLVQDLLAGAGPGGRQGKRTSINRMIAHQSRLEGP